MSDNDLTDAQIEILKQHVIKEIEKIEEIKKHAKQSAKIVSLDDPIGRLSRMDAIQQQKMAEEALRRSVKVLEDLKATLIKIENGTFGYCANCEEPINFGRLKAMPETPFCIKCQSKLAD